MLVPVPVPKLRAGLTHAYLCVLCVATICVWTLGAGLTWRDPAPPGTIPPSGIANERAFWSVSTHQQHSDNAAQYVRALLGTASATGSLEWLTGRRSKRRPGHTKWVNPAWIVAEYSNVSDAPGIPAAQIAAARFSPDPGPAEKELCG